MKVRLATTTPLMVWFSISDIMIIGAVKISLKIKIYAKYRATMDEIENVMLQDKPYFSKAKFGVNKRVFLI